MVSHGVTIKTKSQLAQLTESSDHIEQGVKSLKLVMLGKDLLSVSWRPSWQLS